MNWPELADVGVRLALGDLAVSASRVGLWSVILMRDRSLGAGIRITDEHREQSRATIEALDWAMANVKKEKPTEVRDVPRRVLSAVHTTKPCPQCGERQVMRIAYGTIVLGHSCRACKWERPC